MTEYEEFLNNQPDYNPNEEQVQEPIYKPLFTPVEPIIEKPVKKLPILPKLKEKNNRKIFWKVFSIFALLTLIFFSYAFYQKEFKTDVDVVNNPAVNNVDITPENIYNHEIINNIEISLDDEFIEDIADRIIEQVNWSLNSS